MGRARHPPLLVPQDSASFAQLRRIAYETAENASPTTTFVAAPPTFLGVDPTRGAISGRPIRTMDDNGVRVGKSDTATGRWTGSYDQIGIHPSRSPGASRPRRLPATGR